MNPRTTSRRVSALVAMIVATTVASPLAHAADSTYTVQRGDGFYRIARKTGVPVDAILEANGLTLKSVIHPGQVLTIPAGDAAATSATTPAVPAEVASSADLVAVFRSAAQEAGVPADLLMAIGYHESRWRSDVVSSAGAIGIGQLMPRTAAWVARDLMGEPNLDPRRATDNIRMSARLMRYLVDRAGGDVNTALAMYAQGVDGVRRNGVTAATRTFIDEIARLRTQFD